jgi:hypothetical protein
MDESTTWWTVGITTAPVVGEFNVVRLSRSRHKVLGLDQRYVSLVSWRDLGAAGAALNLLLEWAVGRLYEAHPMALVMEWAGGAASTGRRRNAGSCPSMRQANQPDASEEWSVRCLQIRSGEACESLTRSVETNRLLERRPPSFTQY